MLQPKYWCKHCSTYVKETPFERKQHESTAKHQNNLKRFLRDIQNSHERGERDKERAKSEVERLSRIARGGSEQSSSTTITASSKPTPPPVQKSTQTSADQKRQWAQLAEMGIQIPEQFRAEVAMAGDWKVVSEQPIDEPQPEEPLSVGVKKRKYEGENGDEEEAEAERLGHKRGWGATTKRYPGHEKDDLDDLLSGTMSLKREKAVASSAQLKNEEKDFSEQESEPNLDEKPGEGGTKAAMKDEGPLKRMEKHDRAHVKDEADAAGQFRPMGKIPEDVPIPIFKKRKAKVS
ncbi:uncharacterized protein Z518_05863 [Rhinocladiella mackenziei CBS 650.93]|uniref:Rhinocladiella mackenziei CBS 650.93 unplaced genomic scaffold supercont1.4, whole genome shotgun sequence n=1 Tax=Rhinocladiella mackenziei CBS 650.93 TaxID=1442369 RepID=A0A0D2IPC1_9EURO|nr:uncharacterized protein Z518_05863 [Rhinocladiella mackenziei CBS 650.93]KIX04991.1 hypothetical protein Z518_05863 [Rhinocladiella mackenziei CBS 650.93]